MFLYETYEPDTVIQKERWTEIQGDYYIPLQTVIAEGIISNNIYLEKIKIFLLYINLLDVLSFVNFPQCHQTHQSIPVCFLCYLVCLNQYIHLMCFLLNFLHPGFYFEHLKEGKEFISCFPFRYIEIK